MQSVGGSSPSLRGHSDEMKDAVFSPDGRFLATASDDTATVWDAASGQELLTLLGHRKLCQVCVLQS